MTSSISQRRAYVMAISAGEGTVTGTLVTSPSRTPVTRIEVKPVPPDSRDLAGVREFFSRGPRGLVEGEAAGALGQFDSPG
ncbi:MAG TPA: hypothetical protein VFG53_01915 [Anaeromyxobacter sp.]|nr:hypothetical protein [Anaeromyxobacter sp.]